MDDEKLIELVRRNEVLYDFSHPKYMQNPLKDSIWKKISEEMKRPATDCKTRWGNIRDNYRKSLRKLASKGGKIKKYKYSSQLKFLDCMFEERKIKGILPTDNNTTTETRHSWQDYSIETENPSDTNIQDNANYEGSSCKPQQNQEQVSTLKRKYKKPKSASSRLMKYLIKKNQAKSKRKSETDAVDAFLAGLAPTLKKFSPYYLNLAKTKIFSVVQEYDLAMIMDKEKTKTTGIQKYLSADHITTRFQKPSASPATTSRAAYTYSPTPPPISTFNVSGFNVGHASSTSSSFETPIASSANFNSM